MNPLEDPKLKSLITRRNLREKTIRQYKTTFQEIYNFLGKTPTQLIDEAKQEQRPDWEKKRFLEIEERKVTHYLNDYYDYLKNDKKNIDSTIKNKITKLRAFYGEYNIELPKGIILSSNNRRTRRTDIPTLEEVATVVDKLENKKYVAIVYFMFTSGIRSGDLCELTIGDLLEATKKWHNGNLEDLLNKDPYEYSIRPAWDFDPEKTDKHGNITLTSNTPQAMKALFDYLEKRINEGYSVNKEDALFRSEGIRSVHTEKSNFFDSATLAEIFKNEINPIFNTKDEEGNIVVRKDKKGYSFFRAHNLRTLFKTTCSANLPKAMLEVEERGHISKNIDILSLLTGHEPPNPQITKTYEAVDHEDIDPYYFHLIPYLTIGEIKAKDAHSDEYREMKDELDKRDERISKLEENKANWKEEVKKEVKEELKKELLKK